MNNSFLKIAAISALMASSASAATYTINLTGSTAFRASTHTAILANLSSPTYAYTDPGTNGRDKATYVIFKGTSGSDTYNIRCTWSGSVEGVQDLADAKVLNWLPTTTTTSGPGTVLSGTESSFATSTAVADGAMSDVFQVSASRSGLTDKVVAVVPFVFIANNGAPITNMTPQIFRGIYGPGGAPLRLVNGDTSKDTANGGGPVYVFGVGRDIGSGTRATAMAETGFGINSAVAQYTVTTANSTISGSDIFSVNSPNGYTKGSTMATDLAKTSGDSVGYFVGYVGIADAVANNVKLTYNSVTYSAAATYNGTYTFWGYEHLFTPSRVQNASSGNDLAAKNFFAGMATSLASNPGGAGLNPANMLVHRDGDGATVLDGALP